MGFDRVSFGSVVLSRKQAVGTGVHLELSVGRYQNEPTGNYKDWGKVRKTLAVVQLHGFENRRIWEMSGGQQQRISQDKYT